MLKTPFYLWGYLNNWIPIIFPGDRNSPSPNISLHSIWRRTFYSPFRFHAFLVNHRTPLENVKNIADHANLALAENKYFKWMHTLLHVPSEFYFQQIKWHPSYFHCLEIKHFIKIDGVYNGVRWHSFKGKVYLRTGGNVTHVVVEICTS